MGKLHATWLDAIGAGESASLVAEKFALQKSARNGWTADLDEGSASPRRLRMDQLREHLLTRAALPAQQDREIGTCGFFQFLTDLAHDRRVSKDHLFGG